MSSKTLASEVKKNMETWLHDGLVANGRCEEPPEFVFNDRTYKATLANPRNGLLLIRVQGPDKSFLFKVDVTRCAQDVEQLQLIEEEASEVGPDEEIVVEEETEEEEETQEELVEHGEAEDGIDYRFVRLPESPTVLLPIHVYSKITELCIKSAGDEVAWFGTVNIKNNAFVIDEVYLPRQVVGVATDRNDRLRHLVFRAAEGCPIRIAAA